jgi:hypothetical protein
MYARKFKKTDKMGIVFTAASRFFTASIWSWRNAGKLMAVCRYHLNDQKTAI